MKRIVINTGDRFGKLTIVKELDEHIYPTGQKRRKFKCLCDCGNQTITLLHRLRNKHTMSCGCHQKKQAALFCETAFTGKIIHGHAIRKNGKSTNTRTYISWKAMIQRCTNPKVNYYKNYGGREKNPIIVCDRWLNSFKNFLKDMGERPEGTSIDRINVDGNYEPSNCRWATDKEQANNKRNNKKMNV
jgi:hypothetical protein